MNGGTETIYRFEDFLLDPGAAELRRAGEVLALEPQVFDLLALLVAHHDRVVTRDEIVEQVWRGRIVSESAVSSRVNALRKALGDDGTAQRLIRTVHGRGFRFGVAPEAVPRTISDTVSMAAGAAIKTGVRPSIAVLPFEVLSESADTGFFADGIAEDILNALSRFHELSVIARNSSFSFRGQNLPAREVAEALGVKYLLSGSVRQVGTRVRVAVQLIEAARDRALWSDRYDGEVTDIFTVQDEIVGKAVAAIAPQAEYHEMQSASRKSSADLSDWERVMRARWHMDKYSREDTDRALAILGDVVATAPELALAHSTAAVCHSHRMLNTWCVDPMEEIGLADRAARRAVALDPYDAGSLAVMGLAAMWGRRYDECFERLDEAVRLNPNQASAYGFAATARGCQGRLGDTLEAFERAMVLSPRDPTRVLWMSGKGVALILNQEYAAALENCDRMLRIDPDYGPALRQRVSSLSYLGRAEDARVALDALLERMPHLTVTRLAKMVPVVGDDNQQHWLDGLRMAGLPE